MPDAIANLGYCAAVCELEAYLCPWDRTELKRRAAVYRAEQRRLLGALPLPACPKRRMHSEPRRTKQRFPRSRRQNRRRVFA